MNWIKFRLLFAAFLI